MFITEFIKEISWFALQIFHNIHIVQEGKKDNLSLLLELFKVVQFSNNFIFIYPL